MELIEMEVSQEKNKEKMLEEKCGLKILSSQEIYDMEFDPIIYVIDGILAQGTYIFAGAPKIGKSWLMLMFANNIADGKEIWGRATSCGMVLYITLEDNYRRIQDRMASIDATCSNNLKFSIECNEIGDGLESQILTLLEMYPNTVAVFIDTLAKVQKTTDKISYSNDYDQISKIKKITNEKNIAIVLVHHTRKMPDNDAFNTISGSSGILGAVDGAFVLEKDNRSENNAKLSITGRDVPDLTFTLNLDRDTCIWNLVSDDNKALNQNDKWLEILIKYLKRVAHFTGTASELLEDLLEVDDSFSLNPNILSRRLRESKNILFVKHNIFYELKRTANSKTIILKEIEQKNTDTIMTI